ncbi:MAG: hypothetical protein DSY40_03265, partial [Nautilia sp.]
MPWYYRLIISLIVLFIVGCSKQPEIGKKVIENEDSLIIKSLLLEQKNPHKAKKILKNLLDETDKYVYLEEIIKIDYFNKNYRSVIKDSQLFEKKFPDYKSKIIKYEVLSYLRLKRVNKALYLAKRALKENRNIDLYKLIAYIYLQKKEYNRAILYLKSAYSINQSPEILAQMGDIFFKYLKKPNEAISYYQTHIRLYGCEEMICNRLANIYASLYDYDNLVEIYKRLFYSTNNEEYARKIIFLYIEKGEYKKAINFINKNRLSKELLIFTYKE